jgi:hypothetical protein
LHYLAASQLWHLPSAVFLRPFLPSTIGLWLGSEGFDVGVLSHPETQHELLGQGFVPVISLAAFLAAIGTTQALHWMIRRRSPSATYHVPRTAGSGAAQN